MEKEDFDRKSDDIPKDLETIVSPRLRWFIDNIDKSWFNSSIKLLDIGVKDGAWGYYLRTKENIDFQYYGLDRTFRGKATDMTFKIHDIRLIPFPYKNNFFNMILFFGHETSELDGIGIHQEFDMNNLIRDVYRILSKSGIFMYNYPTQDKRKAGYEKYITYPRIYSKEEHIRMISNNKFSIIKFDTIDQIDGLHYVFMCQKIDREVNYEERRI